MFITPEPWEEQYFRSMPPSHSPIPVDDATAFTRLPKFNWVYNKMELCSTQNVPCFPHGVNPVGFPVFSKPITNLFGMGVGAKTLTDWKDEYYTAGHFWMPYLTGTHRSIDVAVDKGTCRWFAYAEGIKTTQSDTEFSYWIIHEKCKPDLMSSLQSWTQKYLPNYTGILNFEMIGDIIIEVHLRMTCQWVDLYGKGWLKNVVELYSGAGWNPTIQPLKKGYSVVQWTTKPGRYEIHDTSIRSNVSSIQFTFNNGVPIEHEANNGKYRLAVVNGNNITQCNQTLKEITSRIKTLDS